MHLILLLIMTTLCSCNKNELLNAINNSSLDTIKCTGEYSSTPTNRDDLEQRFLALKNLEQDQRDCISLQGVDLNNYLEITTPTEQLLNQSDMSSESEYLTRTYGYDSAIESVESYLMQNFGVDNFDSFAYLFKNQKGFVSLFGFTRLSDINFKNVNVSSVIFPYCMSLKYVDFTHVIGLNSKQFNYNFISFSGIKNLVPLTRLILPINFDISELKLDGRNLKNTDFSKTRGLSVNQIEKAVSFFGFRFPINFDISNWNLDGKSLNFINFENTIGLTSAQLQNASSFIMTVFPKMDISQFDMSNKKFVFTDFSNTWGLTQVQLDQAEHIQNIDLPLDLNNNLITNL